MFYVIAFSIVVVLIVVILINRAGNKEMDRKMHDSGADAMISAFHIEGIGLGRRADCDLFLFSDKVVIDHNGRKFEIPLARMRAAVVKTEQEIYEKDKSVVGRALIGTLLVPGWGTIVGGMSGIGTKKVKGKSNTYLILNFVNNNGKLAGVTFLNNFNIIRVNKFCEAVNNKISENKTETVIL
ncbi:MULTISPECIES: hypothetical protein [unclassified Brevibacillus]|jgi:hypothetical protein|uniref:hypothetical protein n=1 Tax=unclassified Brevibacillus TaxID=2684853 RepID=UPI001492AE08|nr:MULTISPECIES: hypothetical protein [unclassified Brevibacillus]MBR8659565.1 hypothetical protein [Brevibacillus sp. NL20B1]NNV01940.1 hypothetical protein [Brevibacillus sp. MCWH]